jgi:hypothetical protein
VFRRRENCRTERRRRTGLGVTLSSAGGLSDRAEGLVIISSETAIVVDFADRAYILRQRSDRQQRGSKVRMENDVGARDGSDDERQEIFQA